MAIEFTNVCFITKNVMRLRGFYETVFNCTSEGDEVHSYLHVAGFGIAIYDKESAQKDYPEKNYHSPGNECFYICFNCDDADMEYSRLLALKICEPTQPKLWPWGAKSFNFRDPDGNNIIFRSWPEKGI